MNREISVASRLRSPLSFLAIIVITAVLSPEFPLGCAQTAAVSPANHARQLVRAGHIDEAIDFLQSALTHDPADPGTRLLLADIYSQNNEPTKAEGEFRELVRTHPQSSSAAIALAAFYINSGSFSAAESVLTDALRRHPKLPELREQLALVLTAEHKYQEASAIIRELPPPLDPTARVQHFRLAASIHSGLGEHVAAAHDMERALATRPTEQQLRWLAALTEADAGEWKACIRNVAPVFVKNPTPDAGLLLLRAQLATGMDFTPTLKNLDQLDLRDGQRFELRIHTAELLASAEKHPEAAKEFREALRLSSQPSNTLPYNLAVEEYASGEYDEALGTIRSIREQHDSAELEDLAADIEERSGNSLEAIHDHQRAIALAPNEERYRLSLGAALLQYRDYKQSADAFQQAIQTFPNSARAYVGLGMADYFIEQYDESISAFLHADQLDGQSGRALAYLAATQNDSATGPSAVAVQAICDRAESHRSDPNAITWCGALLFRQTYLAGDQSGARDIIPRLRTATKLSPHDAVASCALGRALAWTEQFAEARHWLELCLQLRPDSAEDHYRLSQVYRSLDLRRAAAEQASLITKANSIADRHDAMAHKFAEDMNSASERLHDAK